MDGRAPRAREEQALPGEFSSLRTRGAAAWSRRELSEPRQACSDPRADPVRVIVQHARISARLTRASARG